MIAFKVGFISKAYTLILSLTQTLGSLILILNEFRVTPSCSKLIQNEISYQLVHFIDRIDVK